jgi:hypothetical protein
MKGGKTKVAAAPAKVPVGVRVDSSWTGTGSDTKQGTSGQINHQSADMEGFKCVCQSLWQVAIGMQCVLSRVGRLTNRAQPRQGAVRDSKLDET